MVVSENGESLWDSRVSLNPRLGLHKRVRIDWGRGWNTTLPKQKRGAHVVVRPPLGQEGLLRHEADLPALLGAFALALVEDLLAQAETLGRGLDVFVDVDVFQGTL